MSVASGIASRVKTASVLANTRVWSIATSADVQKIVSSLTKGGAQRIAGNKDWSGSYQAYGHTPVVLPGDTFTFTGVVTGGTAGDAIVATGPALCNQIVIVIDIEGGKIIEHTVSFEADGALQFLSDQTVAIDTTALIGPTSIGCIVKLGTVVATPVFSDISDVRTVTITITKENQSYVSSSTAGETKRIVGNMDASIAISIYESDWTNLPAVNSESSIRVYVDGSTYWDFNYGVFQEISDLDCDREGAALVAATLNAQFTGIGDVAGTPTYGYIKKPDASTWWGA